MGHHGPIMGYLYHFAGRCFGPWAPSHPGVCVGSRHLHSTTMAVGLWRHAPWHWPKAVQLLQRCRESRVALEPWPVMAGIDVSSVT